MQWKFEMQYQGLLRNLSKIKDRSAGGMYLGLEKVLVFLENAIKMEVRSKFRSTGRISMGRTGIAATGRLSTDWTHLPPRFEGKNLVGIVGTRVKHARVHEFGGDVFPSKTRALTVPFYNTQQAFPPAHELMKQGKTWLNRKTGIVYLKSEAAGIVKKGGKRFEKKRLSVPIYKLKRRIHQKPRHFVKDVLYKFEGRMVSDFYDYWVNSVIRGK